MPKALTEPKVGLDGKKMWPEFYKSMDDKQVVAHTVKVLRNMPMTYLKLLGDRLSQVK